MTEQTPVRVLHVINSLNRGGAETQLQGLTAAMDSGRVWSSVACLTGGGALTSLVRKAGVPVHDLGFQGRLPARDLYSRLRRVLNATMPDVVHGWMPHGNLVALWASSWCRVPLLWGIRGSIYDLRYERPTTRLAIRAGALLSRLTARCIYNSRIAAAQHERLGYAPERTLVIPNGFDTIRFAPDPVARARVRTELGIGEVTPLIGMIARWHAVKDHATFLRSAARVAKTYPAACIMLAGRDMDAGNPVLVEQIRSAGIEERVFLLGERPDAAALQASLDVGVLSSYSEGFPNTIGEAMACAVPCVATAVGETPHLVGDTGRVVEARHPEALADAISSLLALSPADRAALGRRARERVESEFSLSGVSRKYEALYEAVTAAA